MTTGEFLGFYGCGVLAAMVSNIIRFTLVEERPLRVRDILFMVGLSWICLMYWYYASVNLIVNAIPWGRMMNYVVYDPVGKDCVAADLRADGVIPPMNGVSLPVHQVIYERKGAGKGEIRFKGPAGSTLKLEMEGDQVISMTPITDDAFKGPIKGPVSGEPDHCSDW